MAETEGDAVLDAEDLLMLGPGSSVAVPNNNEKEGGNLPLPFQAVPVPLGDGSDSSDAEEQADGIHRAEAGAATKKKINAPSERDLPTGVRKISSGRYQSATLWGDRQRTIGTFDTREQASVAYMSVKKDLGAADLSALSADEVDAAFDASKKKAVDAVGGTSNRKSGPPKGYKQPCPDGSGMKKGRKRKLVDPVTAASAGASQKQGRLKRAAVDNGAKTGKSGVGQQESSHQDLPQGVTKISTGKFISTIYWSGKRRRIGTFSTPERASAAHLSVKDDLDAKLSAVGPDEVNDVFDAAKAKARELFGWIKKSNPRKGTGFIDLAGVLPQPLILKNQLGATLYKDNSRRRPTKESSSKYTGIYYCKTQWKAQIMVEGKVRSIGYYDTEEDAAADYARAAYKYKKKKKSLNVYGNVYGGLDLSGVPESLPLICKEGTATGFAGVKRMKGRFQARIAQQKKYMTLGTFDTPEEAALIYARAKWYLESKPQGKKEGTKVASGLVEEPHSSDTGFIADFVHRMDGKGGNDGQDADNAPVDNSADDPVDRSHMSDIDYSEVGGVAV